jgi:hypothetical protein
MLLVNQILWGLGLTGFTCAAVLEYQMRSDLKEKDPSVTLGWRSSQARREHARLFPESNKRKLAFVAYSFFFVGIGLAAFGIFK